jgi:predicted enzyme involved in methoxymalonyl-ACP biosynthesis
VSELGQRTNQLNVSGNRYHQSQLVESMKSPYLEACVIDCCDRYRSYGVVAFAGIDPHEPRTVDLMFSCRVQGKRVEHAEARVLLRQLGLRQEEEFLCELSENNKERGGGKSVRRYRL